MASAQERGTKGRVVVVTGAARGIGRAVTARCVAAGMNVVALDQSEDALAHLSQEVSAERDVIPLVGDVARQETAEAAAVVPLTQRVYRDVEDDGDQRQDHHRDHVPDRGMND